MFLTTYEDAQKGSEAGADDIKTVVEIITNEKGQKVRVTKRFKLAKKAVRVNKRVEARRKWKKFGECAGLPPGPEKVITTVAEEIFFDYPKSTCKCGIQACLTRYRQGLRQGGKGGRHEGCSSVFDRVPKLRQAGSLDSQVPTQGFACARRPGLARRSWQRYAWPICPWQVSGTWPSRRSWRTWCAGRRQHVRPSPWYDLLQIPAWLAL